MESNIKMIRILHITGGMDRAGAETMIMNLYRAIDREQLQFDFLYFKNKKCDYDDEIERLGGRIFRITKKNPVKRFFAIQSFLQAHREYKIVHSHTLFNTGFNLLAARSAGIPHRIAHSHNTSRQSVNAIISYLYKTMSRQLINKFATGHIACGEQASEFLFGKTIKPTLLYNAIDIDNYIATSVVNRDFFITEYGLDRDCLVFLQVGRIEKVKNHAFSVEVMKHLKEKGVKFKFFIIGQGDLREEIQDKVNKCGLSENVVFTGVRGDVVNFMAGATAMLMPSLHEGFPVVLVEAQAVGLPSLISDTVSQEVDLDLSLTHFQNLKVSADKWAENLLSLRRNNDAEHISITLKKKGFDVIRNAEIISGIYRNLICSNE